MQSGDKFYSRLHTKVLNTVKRKRCVKIQFNMNFNYIFKFRGSGHGIKNYMLSRFLAAKAAL